MQKRCKRRHFAPSEHPMLQPPGPLACHDLIDLRLREHLALDDLAHWSGQPADLRVLQITAAVALVLAADGYGADELAELEEADAVLRSYRVNPPGITGVTQADLAPLRWLLAYADAQRAVVTRRDYHRALARVRQEPSRYGWQA